MANRQLVLAPRFWLVAFFLSVLLLPVGFLGGCEETKKEPPITKDPVDLKKLGVSQYCPGAEGCMDNTGTLEVGASSKSITPASYEVARWNYYREEGFCPAPTPKAKFGIWRCGQLHSQAMYNRKDCGLDGVCPRDNIKTRIECKDTQCPDGLTCNDADKRCYIKYKEPDADGSEKDGMPDWFLDCGKDQICPCVDPDGQPSYYGKGKQCLKGHTKNDKYKGPDEDGTEGNGAFDGVWMGGFEGNHPAQGSHDEIWARAFVMKTGKTTIAVVSLDLVGFFYNQVQQIRDQIKAKLKDKADIDYILLSSSHGHEGPDTLGLWGRHESGVPATSGMDLKYMEFIRNQTTEAILDAYNQMKPAKVYAATIQTGGQGFIRDSRDPVIIDDTLNVLQFVPEAGGTPIATIVNWGNHPETLSDSNNFITSDFPHYVRDALEKGIPAKGSFKGTEPVGGVAIYLQAAVGGLMTQLGVTVPDVDGTEQSKSNWDKARALGYQVALKALKALEKKEEVKTPALSIMAKELVIDMDNRYYHIGFTLNLFNRDGEGFDPDLPINKENLPKVRTEISLIRLGDVTLFSMPGELDPQVLIGGYDGKYSFGKPIIDPKNTNPPDLTKAPKGPYFKSKIPGKYKLFVGLGNDQLGYILPTWNWQLHPKTPYFSQADGDHYEETNSVGPDTLPKIMGGYDILLKLMSEVTKAP